MANKNLNAAKTAKKDEFYMQFTDIERESLDLVCHYSYSDSEKNTQY